MSSTALGSSESGNLSGGGANQPIIAVMDSGTSINLITPELARLLDLEVVRRDPPFIVKFGKKGSKVVVDEVTKPKGMLGEFAVSSQFAVPLVNVRQFAVGDVDVLFLIDEVLLIDKSSRQVVARGVWNGCQRLYLIDLRLLVADKEPLVVQSLVVRARQVQDAKADLDNPDEEDSVEDDEEDSGVSHEIDLHGLPAGRRRVKSHQISQKLQAELIRLHHRTGHTRGESIAQCIETGAWILDFEVDIPTLKRFFAHFNCQDCLAATHKFAIPQGLGVAERIPGRACSIDYIGPISPPSTRGATGLIMLTDLATFFAELYIVKDRLPKSVIKCLRTWFNLMRQCQHHPTLIKSDSGSVELSGEVEAELARQGVKLIPAPPGDQRANPNERSWQTIKHHMFINLMSQLHLGARFWAHAAIHAATCRNRVQNQRSMNLDPHKSPVEIIIGSHAKPDLISAKFAFGERVVFKRHPHISNLPLNEKGFFVGYDPRGGPSFRVTRSGALNPLVRSFVYAVAESMSQVRPQGAIKDSILIREEEDGAIDIKMRDGRDEKEARGLQDYSLGDEQEEDCEDDLEGPYAGLCGIKSGVETRAAAKRRLEQELELQRPPAPPQQEVHQEAVLEWPKVDENGLPVYWEAMFAEHSGIAGDATDFPVGEDEDLLEIPAYAATLGHSNLSASARSDSLVDQIRCVAEGMREEERRLEEPVWGHLATTQALEEYVVFEEKTVGMAPSEAVKLVSIASLAATHSPHGLRWDAVKRESKLQHRWILLGREEMERMFKKAAIQTVDEKDTWNGDRYPPRLVFQEKLDASGKPIKLRVRATLDGSVDNRRHFFTGMPRESTMAPNALVGTVLLVLQLAVSLDLVINKLDYASAFLNTPASACGTRTRPIYTRFPAVFFSNEEVPVGGFPQEILDKWQWVSVFALIYGLKDAGRGWYNVLNDIHRDLGLKVSSMDPCFFFHFGESAADICLVAITTDDCLWCVSNSRQGKAWWDRIQTYLNAKKIEFTTEAPCLEYTGMLLVRDTQQGSLHITMPAKAIDITKAVFPGMALCDIPCPPSPLDLDFHSRVREPSPPIHPSTFRSTLGLLFFPARILHIICPAISMLAAEASRPTVYTMGQLIRLCAFVVHFHSVGLTLWRENDRPLQAVPVSGASDASWNLFASGQSQLGGLLKIGGMGSKTGAIIAFSHRTKGAAPQSAAMAELMAMKVVAEYTVWIRAALEEIGLLDKTPSAILQDNSTAAVVVSSLSKATKSCKAAMRALSLLAGLVNESEIATLAVDSEDQPADPLSKLLRPGHLANHLATIQGASQETSALAEFLLKAAETKAKAPVYSSWIPAEAILKQNTGKLPMEIPLRDEQDQQEELDINEPGFGSSQQYFDETRANTIEAAKPQCDWVDKQAFWSSATDGDTGEELEGQCRKVLLSLRRVSGTEEEERCRSEAQQLLEKNRGAESFGEKRKLEEWSPERKSCSKQSRKRPHL